MKKFILIISACVVAGSLIAANVKMEYTGPSGAGDIYWKAPSTGTTNFAMGVSGLYNVTLDPAYPITGAMALSQLTVSGAITGATLRVTGNSVLSGTLAQTGVATFTATPICKDGLTVGTNVTLSALTASKPVFTDANKVLVSTGTLGVDQGGSGAATFTDNGVLIGNAANAFSVTAVGTDGQVFLGASGANPTWGTMGGDASISAGGTVTIGASRINGNMIIDGTVSNADIADSAVNNAKIGTDVAVGKLVVAASKVIVGNAAGAGAAQTISGLFTLNTSGVATAEANSITGDKLVDGTVSNADIAVGVGLDKIAPGTATYVPIAGVGGVLAYKALSGDITLDTNGVTTIGAGTVHAGMLDATIVTNVLAAGMVLPAVDLSVSTNISLASLTNSFVVGPIYSGTITNVGLGSTNTLVFKNGILMSVTLVPAP